MAPSNSSISVHENGYKTFFTILRFESSYARAFSSPRTDTMYVIFSAQAWPKCDTKPIKDLDRARFIGTTASFFPLLQNVTHTFNGEAVIDVNAAVQKLDKKQILLSYLENLSDTVA